MGGEREHKSGAGQRRRGNCAWEPGLRLGELLAENPPPAQSSRCAQGQSCPAGHARRPPRPSGRTRLRVGASSGLDPGRRPRSAFSLAPGPAAEGGVRGGARRGAEPSRGALAAAGSQRRVPPAAAAARQRAPDVPARAARTDFPEGRRGRHGDCPGSGRSPRCLPSPTPDATDRSPAAPARRRGPSSRVRSPSSARGE